MGIDLDFGIAYAKSQFGARQKLPTSGTRLRQRERQTTRTPCFPVAAQFKKLGFDISGH